MTNYEIINKIIDIKVKLNELYSILSHKNIRKEMKEYMKGYQDELHNQLKILMSLMQEDKNGK